MSLQQLYKRIYDYIFLCFFLGNDFMPHFPSINIRTGGVDKMIQAYKATIGGTNENLTDGKKIYWKNLRKMVQFLADNEHNFIKQEHKVRDRKEKHRLPDLTPEDKLNNFINMPTYERSIEKFINPYKDNWQERYYSSLFDLKIDEERRRQISINYLEGLEWTMKYYTVGCPDWRWSYKYSYPPLLCDLIRYIPFFDTDLISNKQDNPVTELVQLCYVLPRQSLQFLPEKLYKALIREKLRWYGTDCDFHWSYCKYFWEAHPHLEHIDLDELEARLRALVRRYPRHRFVWLMGADNLAQFHRWRDWRRIARTMPIAVIARPGYDSAAIASPAMAWLHRYRLRAGSLEHRRGWSAPALVTLRFDPDSRSATALRKAEPHWAARMAVRSLRDGITHRPIPEDAA